MRIFTLLLYQVALTPKPLHFGKNLIIRGMEAITYKEDSSMLIVHRALLILDNLIVLLHQTITVYNLMFCKLQGRIITRVHHIPKPLLLGCLVN